MNKLLYKLKSFRSIALNYIPHFRSYNKVRYIKYEADLCLIRSKLQDKSDELSRGISELTSKYSSIVITKDKSQVNDLLLMENNINEICIEVRTLLEKNINTTNKIDKINNYTSNNKIESKKGKVKLINRAIDLINEFEISSGKISSLNLIETP